MNNVIALQGTITATGTAQNLPASPVRRAVTIAAKAGNTASIVIGNATTVTATTGYILAAGASVTVDLQDGNLDSLWVVGTSADVFSVLGA